MSKFGRSSCFEILTIEPKHSYSRFDYIIVLQLTYGIQKCVGSRSTAIFLVVVEKMSCMILVANRKSYHFDVPAGIQQSCWPEINVTSYKLFLYFKLLMNLPAVWHFQHHQNTKTVPLGSLHIRRRQLHRRHIQNWDHRCNFLDMKVLIHLDIFNDKLTVPINNHWFICSIWCT